jgi:uncharacterized cupin superfamily protein
MMERVVADEVDSWLSPAAEKRPLGEALGAEEMAVNYYELDEGDSFGFGYHRHPGQEEVFYVMAGTATFETEDGDIEVGAGEAIRFAPGEWQRGTNRGGERVRALALGAPADSGDADIRRDCPDCGERTPASVERAPDGEGLVTVCGDCGAETGRFA